MIRAFPAGPPRPEAGHRVDEGTERLRRWRCPPPRQGRNSRSRRRELEIDDRAVPTGVPTARGVGDRPPEARPRPEGKMPPRSSSTTVNRSSSGTPGEHVHYPVRVTRDEVGGRGVEGGNWREGRQGRVAAGRVLFLGAHVDSNRLPAKHVVDEDVNEPVVIGGDKVLGRRRGKAMNRPSALITGRPCPGPALVSIPRCHRNGCWRGARRRWCGPCGIRRSSRWCRVTPKFDAEDRRPRTERRRSGSALRSAPLAAFP